MISFAKDFILGTVIACFWGCTAILIAEQIIAHNINFGDMGLCLAVICSMQTKGKQLIDRAE